MFDPNDTIVAVATPPTALRSIIRISGPACRDLCARLGQPLTHESRKIYSTHLILDKDLSLAAQLYVFCSPRSYTGQDVIEIHAHAAPVIVNRLLEHLLACDGVRRAGPGEFTARAYLNSKLDLAQAEAINEIIHSTNQLQLSAAQALLQGRLGVSLDRARQALLDCLALLEADLDFSQEDIELISRDEAVARLDNIVENLQTLLDRGLSDQNLIHLPSVGLAGLPNAGKSSLFNALLERPRSIVSDTERTTRDVLGATLSLAHHRCVLFDCAGLLERPFTLLDRLAQQAALESLQHCRLVIFCVDINKSSWQDDYQLYRQLDPAETLLVATQIDRYAGENQPTLDNLQTLWGHSPLPVSAHTGENLQSLRDALNRHLGPSSSPLSGDDILVTLGARHRSGINNSIETVGLAITALHDGLTEVAAMYLRTAYQHLGETAQHVDEEILGQIFGRFCIGK
ncbi:tRNA modification GTPase [Planctomycetota bacterium]